jgi:hypothetical protein
MKLSTQLTIYEGQQMKGRRAIIKAWKYLSPNWAKLKKNVAVVVRGEFSGSFGFFGFDCELLQKKRPKSKQDRIR